MSTRRYTYFNETLIQGNQYLNDNIIKSIQDKDGRKFSCLPCQKKLNKESHIYFEGLSRHLSSFSHKKTATNDKEKTELALAIKYLTEKEEIDTKNNELQMKKKDRGSLMEVEKVPENQGEMEKDTSSAEEIQENDEEFKNEDIGKKQKNRNKPLPKNNELLNFRFQVTEFLINNNLSFNLTENFAFFLRKLLGEYSVNSLQSFTVNRNHISEIAKFGISPSLKEEYLKILETTPYSVSLDESGSKGNTQYLAISARFLPSIEATQTVTKLLGLLEMKTSASGETLYQMLTDFLFSNDHEGKRRKNLMGVSTDGASNMISLKDAGLTNRLRNDIPHVIVTINFCHALNLVLKACIKQFPKEYRKFMEDVAKTFSKSPQKVQKLKEIICHSHKEEKVLSIIKYVKTRWSSFQECLSRILEMREPLKSFFEKEKDTKKLSFFDLENTLILQLLLCLVNKVNKYIKLFQKDNLDMMSIVFILKECAITLGDFKYKILDDHENFTVIKPFMDNDEYYHKIEKFLLDQNVQETLKERTFEEFQSYFIEKHPNFQKDLLNVSEEFRAKFFELAKIFLMTALQQIKDRLPWEPSKIIILTDAFKMKNTSSIKNLQILGTYFSNVIPENELSKFNDELISLEVNGLQVVVRCAVLLSAPRYKTPFGDHETEKLLEREIEQLKR